MYEAGKRAPKYAPLSVLADFFHVSTDYLLGHESNSTYSKQINAKFPFIVLPKDKNYIPVLGSVRCGLNAPTDEHIEEYIGIDDKYRADEMIGFYAEGDSMEPEIHDGDICLVHLAVYAHLAQAMDDIKLGRVESADSTFSDILGELENLEV